MKILPCLLKDSYKAGHVFQYPVGTRLVYSNLTPRRSRVPGVNAIVWFGLQYFLKRYLLEDFSEGFFAQSRDTVLKAYKRRVDAYLGPDAISIGHIGALHELGYLPLHIKGVAEGTLVPMRVPAMTIRNTLPEFFWLTNMLETLLSNILWLPSTSATTAYRYRLTFERFARDTGADPAFVKWQGHDFSFRGMAGVEAALLSGAAHLLSFAGTDTIPAIDFLETYYGADAERELIGGSVPATEHSVLSMGGREDELGTIRRLITEVYPKGIVSIVSDTWDFWKVLTEYLPALKAEILARDGKVVIRPDSGDPVDIICGTEPCQFAPTGPAAGAIETLARTFGTTATKEGYAVLDSHVGLIYGDSITPERQVAILTKLRTNGYASSNVVLGIGSYTYQMVSRDTYGFAMKATYGETDKGGQAIYKDPATDDGTKKSAAGLLCVREGLHGELICEDFCRWLTEEQGLLKTVFHDGVTYGAETLAGIRARIDAHVAHALENESVQV